MRGVEPGVTAALARVESGPDWLRGKFAPAALLQENEPLLSLARSQQDHVPLFGKNVMSGLPAEAIKSAIDVSQPCYLSSAVKCGSRVIVEMFTYCSVRST